MSQYTKTFPSPITDFDKWAPLFADWYIRRFLKLTRRAVDNQHQQRWNNPDPGIYDDAVGYAIGLLYQKKDHIQSAKFPKQCAKYILGQLKHKWPNFNTSGWILSEWHLRRVAEAKAEAQRRRPNADEPEKDLLTREICIEELGVPAHIYDTIYGQPLRLWDVEAEDGEQGPGKVSLNVEVGNHWLEDKKALTPEEEVVGQLSFLDFLEEECDEADREFLYLCEGRTDTEVSRILHEHVSTTGRRKKKLLEAFRSWIKAST